MATPRMGLSPRGRRGRGNALIVSLIFLLVLTLIGVSSMNSSLMQEKMAGNMRDQQLAFQSAEAAIRQAESYIGTLDRGALKGWDGSHGLFGIDTAEPDYYDSGNWRDAPAAPALQGVQTQPHYIIKYLGEVQSQEGTTRVCNYGCARPPAASVFRITARGTGSGGSSMVLIQSHFGRYFQ